MAGYVIHLAVAEEYLRKHKSKKENYAEFIDGVISPDGVKNKGETHYGPSSAEPNLELFLKDKTVDNSFNRGYFIHLLTDYIFYNKYIEKTSKKDMYSDYDLLNAYLIDKYKVSLPEKVKNKVIFKTDCDLVILSKELIERFIEEVSSYDIDEIVEEIKINPEKWTKIRKLIRY